MAESTGGDTGKEDRWPGLRLWPTIYMPWIAITSMCSIFSDLGNPQDLEDVYAGFDIETIFNRGNHLFLGSMRGMYIYDITNPAVPTFVSEFQHGTACDPVVVDGELRLRDP